jgi:hypothetical protein
LLLETSNPSAQANTTRDRSASRCAVLGRRAHSSNVRRSASVNSNGLLWRFLRMARSVPARPPKYKTLSETRHQDGTRAIIVVIITVSSKCTIRRSP